MLSVNSKTENANTHSSMVLKYKVISVTELSVQFQNGKIFPAFAKVFALVASQPNAMLVFLTSYDLMHNIHVTIIPKFITNLEIGIGVKISISAILSKLK